LISTTKDYKTKDENTTKDNIYDDERLYIDDSDDSSDPNGYSINDGPEIGLPRAKRLQIEGCHSLHNIRHRCKDGGKLPEIAIFEQIRRKSRSLYPKNYSGRKQSYFREMEEIFDYRKFNRRDHFTQKLLSVHIVLNSDSIGPKHNNDIFWRNSAAADISNDDKSTSSDKFTIDVKKSDTKSVSRFVKSLFCCFELRPSRLSTFTIYRSSECIRRDTLEDKFLLPPVHKRDLDKKCLIVDLDETLVHSSFQVIDNPDFVIPVEIDNIIHQIYVRKRPHVDEFLRKIDDLFECVLFTASLGKYAEPVADIIDKKRVFKHRLMRDACVLHKGNYIKDLTRLGRCVESTIIVDNSPVSYAFHPDNALPIQSWYDDADDTQLLDLLPLLHDLSQAKDIYPILKSFNAKHYEPVNLKSCCDQSSENSTLASDKVSQYLGKLVV
uniref:protein-serine/threonine phosphatase n=1 Tax=Romanomermis culicivorax TaxID=13658 RepID=A0A915IR08_ROMCU